MTPDPPTPVVVGAALAGLAVGLAARTWWARVLDRVERHHATVTRHAAVTTRSSS